MNQTMSTELRVLVSKTPLLTHTLVRGQITYYLQQLLFLPVLQAPASGKSEQNSRSHDKLIA